MRRASYIKEIAGTIFLAAILVFGTFGAVLMVLKSVKKLFT